MFTPTLMLSRGFVLRPPFSCLLFLCLVGIAQATEGGDSSHRGEQIDFSEQVSPILSDKCFHCHGPDSENQDSDFRADSKENLFADLGGYFAVKPGDLKASELHTRIHSTDESDQMPPPDSNRSLSKDDIRILDAWIQQGAPYEGHWSFERIVRPRQPTRVIKSIAGQIGWEAATSDRWLRNPIDSFIGARLIESGLYPSEPADYATQLRRAAMTLTGLLPPESLQAAIRQNPTEETYQQSVDALLGSMAYAERQSLRWLDAARYADTDGYQNDSERTNWPWRDWVTHAFDENMPFDQFTIQQIAGDMLPEATDSQRLATTFNRNHRQNNEGGALAPEFLAENVIDRVETTSTVFLGLTFGCSRCHDHKYDPLSQKEFYQLFAYFNNIGEKGIGKGIEANPTMTVISPLVSVDPDLLSAYRQAQASLGPAQKDVNKRMEQWIKTQDEKTVDDQETLDDPKVVKILKKAAKKRSKEDKKTLQSYYESIDPLFVEVKKQFSVAKKSLRDAGGIPATAMVMKERESEPTPAYLLMRGQYDAPDKSETLTRGVPKALLIGNRAKQPTDRLELAKWFVSRDNPLTARVTVNRIWQDHFGTGLVKTTADFGLQGEVPSHPGLLDWLAAEFIESGWDVKALHRLIVTSATYRQSSKANPELIAGDPANRLLARGPRYRGDGFMIRDIALQASGLLNEKPGGPSVKPYQPAGLWESVAANKGTKYKTSKGGDLYRKSMYSYWKRAVNPPRQIIFDAGGREVCNVRLRRTNTPLQALALMNDPTFVEASRALAQSAMNSQDSAYSQDSVQPQAARDDSRIAEMYRLAIGRKISSSNAKVLIDSLEFFRQHYQAQPDDALKLISVGQSDRDKNLSTIDHAAFTAVAHVILNLDEFVSVE